MQNLRDQLLKKGLINKGQKQQVEQEKRRERKQMKKGEAEALAQEQQRQAYEAKLEAQRVADRQRAAEQHALLETKERLLRIRHIADYWKLSEEPSGTRRWYFVSRSQVVKYLYVSEPIGLQLSTGTLAIVERPDEFDEPRYVLIEREAAELVARVDPTYVRFHNTTLDVDDDT
ncbi:MAG: DUF2058 domain-containing protein [Candidatus Tectomicrobia bacterium]|uniref:DUF2058 domain-containing protein n=1 Tax=Tectimicrobiota bacterium TaxID=2528274 RepID=A0A938B6B3_UNCTE|nr:DUF2058 domain-containing protein [Candidatus Tectomicrobia bacterium]